MKIFTFILIIFGIFSGSFGGIFLKKGAVEIDYTTGIFTIILTIITNFKIIIGFLLYLTPSIIWIYLLKKIDLSYLQPLMALTYILTPLLAIIFLNEFISILRWIGIIIIIIGIVVVGMS